MRCPVCWLPLAWAYPAYPDCLEQGVVYRHAGAHGIFVDVSLFGQRGCWQQDCLASDKFSAAEPSLCARACWQLPQCLFWSFGHEMCFLRKSRGGREASEASRSFVSGGKSCAPAALPDAWLARRAAQVAKQCHGCDMLRAMTTWRFAIEALQRVLELTVLEQRLDMSSMSNSVYVLNKESLTIRLYMQYMQQFD